MALEDVDHPVLPRRRVGARGVERRPVRHGHDVGGHARRLVGDLVQHVGEVVHGVDDVADVGLLQDLDRRIERQLLVVDDRPDVDAVDVVRAVERVTGDVRRDLGQVHAEPFEQHHRCVQPGRAGGRDPLAEPLEVGGVEPRQVEPRLAVDRRAGTGARPRLRRHAEVHVGPGQVALELLPAPQADEVVAVVGEELEVRGEVEALRLVGAVPTEPQPVLEVAVEVGAGQVHDPPVTGDREVARVVGRDDERARRRGDGPVRIMQVHRPSVRPPRLRRQSQDPGWSSARPRGGAGGGRRTGGATRIPRARREEL